MSDEIKTVIVVSANLDKGPASNRAAVLATGLTAHVDNMVGSNLETKDGIKLLSITQIPIPILVARADMSFLELADKAEKLDCKVIFYLTRAQGMHDYAEYKESVAKTNYQDLDVDGIAIFGDKKSVTKLTGNLAMLR